MDATAQALASFRDTGAFETLATLYIEYSHPELKGLIQTGINEEGKSVPSPVDGIRILRRPGGGHDVVLLAATTTEAKELQRKWLGSTGSVGDVEKAAAVLGQLKEADPEAGGRLFLVSNRPVNLDLIRDVHARASARGIVADPIDASALVRFLDFDADGQFVRETILGVPAERISTRLLREISNESLDAHLRRFPPTHQGGWTISRDIATPLLDLIRRPGATKIALQGPSGCGKSVLLQQVGRLVQAGHGFTLWVPPELLQSGRTADSIVECVLKQLRPELRDGVGTEALRLASSEFGGLILLIDDINRVGQPTHCLEVVNALAGSQGACHWLIAVWPGQIREHANPSASAPVPSEAVVWKIVEIGRYSPAEQELLRGRISDTFCRAFDGDPFLCALVPPESTFSSAEGRSQMLEQILDAFIERASRDAAEQRRTPGTTADFSDALDRLVDFIVTEDVPEPRWTIVRNHLGEAAADRLSLIGERARIAVIDTHWRWTHERLRDLIIGRWLATYFVRVAEGADSGRGHLWRHPGLAEAWAIALAFLRIPQERVDFLAKCQPLCLAKIVELRLLSDEEGERSQLCSRLGALLTSDIPPSDSVHTVTVGAVLSTLAKSNDATVLKICPQGDYIGLATSARFRNGDINAGLQIVASQPTQLPFLPAITHLEFEADALAFGQTHDEHRQELIALFDNLDASNATLTRCLFTLMGYLAWPEFVPVAHRMWRESSDDARHQFLEEFIWVVGRCGAAGASEDIRQALLFASRPSESVPAETGSASAEPIFVALHHAWRRWNVAASASAEFVQFFLQNRRRFDFLHNLLRGIDLPDAVDALLRHAPDVLGLGESVDPLNERDDREWFPVAAATRDQLWSIFSTDPEQQIRRRAFRLWRANASYDDLQKLRSANAEDPLFDKVLAQRLRMRDPTAAPSLASKVRSAPDEWSRFVPAVIGEPGVVEAFESNLEGALKSGNPHAPERVPIHLPADYLRTLVERRGEVLRNCPNIWLALWQSDVPEVLQFLRAVISTCDESALEGFFRRHGWPFPVSRRMLDALTPVLDRFPRDELLFGLGRPAILAGHHEWVSKHLAPRMTPTRRLRWIDSNTARAILDRIARGPVHDWTYRRRAAYRLLHETEKLFGSTLEIVREWLDTPPRPEQIAVAATFLEEVGTGDDLEWWTSAATPSGSPQLVECVTWLLKRRRWHPSERGSEE
jgi:hypothetical protein